MKLESGNGEKMVKRFTTESDAENPKNGNGMSETGMIDK